MRKNTYFFVVTVLIINFFFYKAHAEDVKIYSHSTGAEQIFEYAKQDIKDIQKSKKYFSCGGIGMIDHGAAQDLDVIFFNETSQDFLCTYSLGMCVSTIAPSNEDPCTCPPPTWIAAGCWVKYTEISRSKNRSHYEK